MEERDDVIYIFRINHNRHCSRYGYESDRGNIMIGFAIAFFLFVAWWIVFALAETGANLPKNLRRFTGVDLARGKEKYNVEDYYG